MTVAEQYDNDQDSMVWDGMDRPPAQAVSPDRAPGLAQDFDRMLPHDLAAEKSALGGMLLSKQAITDVAETIKVDDYYRPAHGLIHKVIVEMLAAGVEAVDPVTVAGELGRRGDLAKAGGPDYLHGLVNAVPTAANAEYYAEIVREQAVFRRLVEAGTRIAGMGYAARGDVDEVAAQAAAQVSAVVETRDRENDGFFSIADNLGQSLDMIQAAGSRKTITGIPSGFADLDALTHGWQPGQVIVVGARPGMGKSTLGLDFARACAIHHGTPAAFVSLEMNQVTELNLRLLSAEARVALHHLRSGHMSDEDWTRVARRVPDITAAPLYINDSVKSMSDIQAKLRRLKNRHPDLGLVIIDYLQLIETASKRDRGDSRQEEVSGISRKIKLLAGELNVAIVLLSQLNRGPEQRTDRKPLVSDLRESGAIEQDADIVILLHREDDRDRESARAGEADLIVGKHRGGPKAQISVAFQGHYSRFVDMTRDVT